VIREIEGGVVGLKLVLEVDRLMLEQDPRDVLLVEDAGELRAFERAFALRDQVIDLAGGDAMSYWTVATPRDLTKVCARH
jgi:hypothetical protein